MKILYIEARNKTDVANKVNFKNLPKELFLAYSIQYKKQAEQIKNKLKKSRFKIKGFKQVLGCTKLKSSFPILLIGSGKFHALNLAVQNTVPIYIYDNGIISIIEKEEIEKIRKNKEIALKKLFSAENIGILISTKPGQDNFKKAIELKGKIIKKNSKKKVFIFISNTINLQEIENFQIDVWINSACPGLARESKKIINIDDVLKYFSK